MRSLVVLTVLVNVVFAGHVAVKLPFLNPASVTYTNQPSLDYDYGHQQVAYGAPIAYRDDHYDEHYAHHEPLAYAPAPAAVDYAQVPVKAAVAVPTVQHIPAVADVPFTKFEAQPAVVQKVVEVAKPAIKTRKYEVRRPAIQKQFYDIEERVIIRPVGSALVELDEPLSKAQKGPALVHSLDEPHKVALAAEPAIAVAAASIAHHAVPVAPIAHHALPVAPIAHHALPVAPIAHHALPVTPAVHITPAPHALAITPAPHVAITPIHHSVAITPTPHSYFAHHPEPYAYAQAAIPVKTALPVDTPYLHKKFHQPQFVSTTPVPLHYSTPEPFVVSSTPIPHIDESVAYETAARNEAAYHHAILEAKIANEQALAKAALNAKLAVETVSNGSPHDHHIITAPVIAAPALIPAPVIAAPIVKKLDHLSHEEAQDNQQKLIKLLTAKGGVAEIGFGRAGYAEHVGDAGISRARVLSATPSPYDHPVEEKVNTRRIVVSHPVQTLQEIDVIEPATKVEKIAINQPTVIKTAKVGLERVHTSVPVYGKALAPAIATAQIPVGYYHK